jgi:hypothetical protein
MGMYHTCFRAVPSMRRQRGRGTGRPGRRQGGNSTAAYAWFLSFINYSADESRSPRMGIGIGIGIGIGMACTLRERARGPGRSVSAHAASPDRSIRRSRALAPVHDSLSLLVLPRLDRQPYVAGAVFLSGLCRLNDSAARDDMWKLRKVSSRFTLVNRETNS